MKNDVNHAATINKGGKPFYQCNNWHDEQA